MQSSASSFDPAGFLDTQYEDGLRKNLPPIPEGVYLGRIKDAPAIRTGTSNKDGKQWATADFLFVIDDEEAKKATGLDEPQARFSCFLDFKPGTTQLLTEKDNPASNVKLGRLKDACGIKPGRPWSLRHFDGLTCWVRIKQRTDPDDIETVYSDVVSVSKEKPSRGA